MNFIDKFMYKWTRFRRNAQPLLDTIGEKYKLVAGKVSYAWAYVNRFRKLFLAAPVAASAVIMAINNLIRLPAIVGLDLQANGEFNVEILREVAVFGPLAVTAVCLLLMFISKRTLTPWMVSVVSLILPLVILLTNTFAM